MSRRSSEPITPSPPLNLASAALLVAIVAVPAYFNIQSSTSFEPDKGALLRSLAVIAAVALVFEVVQGIRSGTKPNWSGLRIPALLLTGYVVVITLSTLLGVDFVTSLWGNYERGYGLLSLLAGIVVMITARRMARSGQLWLLIDAILLAAVVPAFYALLQVVGYDPVISQSVSFELGRRASASLGNPLFLANFLLLVIPLGLACFFNGPLKNGPSLSSGSRTALGVYLVFLVLALIATQSLTALGAGLSAAAFFMVAYGKSQNRRGYTVLGLVILFSGFVLLLAAWFAPHLLPARLGDIFASGGSGGQRLMFWEAVLHLMQQEPRWLITGLGPDALALKIAPHLPAQIAHFEVDWVFRLPDRAHTLSLDLLSSGGVLALGLWVLFWAAIIARLLPAFPRHPDYSLAILAGASVIGAALGGFIIGLAAIPVGLMAGLLGGILIILLLASSYSSMESALTLQAPYLLAALVGHWVFLAFNFATHVPDLLVWVIIGLILASPLLETGQTIKRKKMPQERTSSTHYFLLAGIASAAFAFSLSAAWPASLPLWIGVTALLLALVFVLSSNPDRNNWTMAFIPVLSLSPALILNRMAGLSAWLAYTGLLIWLLAMVWLLLPTTDRRQRSLILVLLIPVLLLLNLPVFGDIAYKSALLNPYNAEQRIANINRAFMLSPHDHVLATGMAAIEERIFHDDAFQNGPDAQYVSELYQRAMSSEALAPEPAAAYASWLMQLALDDPAVIPVADQLFEHTLALSPNDIETRNRLALHRWRSGDIAVAVHNLESLLELDPLYGPTYLHLATIQAAQGDVALAEATLEMGIDRVPWWPELQHLLNSIRDE